MEIIGLEEFLSALAKLIIPLGLVFFELVSDDYHPFSFISDKLEDIKENISIKPKTEPIYLERSYSSLADYGLFNSENYISIGGDTNVSI